MKITEMGDMVLDLNVAQQELETAQTLQLVAEYLISLRQWLPLIRIEHETPKNLIKELVEVEKVYAVECAANTYRWQAEGTVLKCAKRIEETSDSPRNRKLKECVARLDDAAEEAEDEANAA